VSDSARIAFVVAVAENGVIGRGGGLPWRLPSDLKRFRATTLGRPLIMGRRTYEAIGTPLDGRDNIVLTRRAGVYPPGVLVAATLPEALCLARAQAAKRAVEEIMIIGGAEIFRAALPLAERIYLTLVHAAPLGDAHLSPFDPRAWRETLREPMQRRAGDEFSADFIVLERIR
jgi:dihydrofolate reductase